MNPIGKCGSAALISLWITDGRGRSAARLCFQHDLPGIGYLLKSEIETRANIFPYPAAMIFGVLRDADNGNRPLHLNCVVNHELTTDRVAAAIEVLHHSFIHYSNTSRRRCILLFNSAARENGNSDHIEIAGAHVVFERDTIALRAAKPGHDIASADSLPAKSPLVE